MSDYRYLYLAKGNQFAILKLVIRINEPGEKCLQQCLVLQRLLGSRSGEAGHSPRAGQAHPMIPYCLAGFQTHCSPSRPPNSTEKFRKCRLLPRVTWQIPNPPAEEVDPEVRDWNTPLGTHRTSLHNLRSYCLDALQWRDATFPGHPFFCSHSLTEDLGATK